MLIYRDECFAIMGACFEVYKNKGCGFLESVYQECLQIELSYRAIPFEAGVHLPLSYRGHRLESYYRADIICMARSSWS